MADNLQGTEQIEDGILRIYGQGEVPVEAVKKFLTDLEYAYNCAYVFDTIGIQAEELLRLTKGRLSTPARNMLWMHLWPPTEEKVASLVPSDQKLQLSSVELHSPGQWDFLGKLNPLEVLRQGINDHHERNKDNEYRNDLEREKLKIENQILMNQAVKGHLENLEKLDITDDDKKILIENFLSSPLQVLKASQDQAVIGGAKMVDSATDQPQGEIKEVITLDRYGQVNSSRPLQVQYITENLPRGIKLELAPIPAGTFLMGSPETELDRYDREGPQHEVTVPSFQMGKFQVTQAQWQAVMGTNPSYFKGAHRPVERVSWDDALEFCQKLSDDSGHSYRLPSEAEWEYACRAGTKTAFHYGDTIRSELANFSENRYTSQSSNKKDGTRKVGSFPPNAFGLYDMHGNVWEYCQDSWHDNYKGAPTDGSAWIEGGQNRIVRGGSWIYSPSHCRSACRDSYSPGDRDYDIGLRVVCSAPRTLQ